MPLKGYKAHKTLHQDGGSDEVSVAALSGELADRQPSKTGTSTLGWTDEKLLKGAGAGNAPEEIDVPAGGGPTIVLKTADETVNNSAILQNDDHLLFAVAANEVWEFEVWVIATTAATPGFKCAFTVPTNGAIVIIGASTGIQTYQSPWVNDYICGITATDGTTARTYSGSLAAALSIFKGRYIGGNTAGNVQFQFAQKVSNAANTTVHANSFVVALKIG